MRQWTKILTGLGGCGVLLGSLDPLEGSVFILAGSGLVALGLYFGRADPRHVKDWGVIFSCNLIGVAALWGLSDAGGIGGESGRSLWWGILVLPYLFGWIMGVVRIVGAVAEMIKARWLAHRETHSRVAKT